MLPPVIQKKNIEKNMRNNLDDKPLTIESLPLNPMVEEEYDEIEYYEEVDEDA